LGLTWIILGTLSWLSLTYAIVLFAFLAPILMDLALVIMQPIEKALSRKWLVAAQKKLRQVNPTVVAITGSYGKTSTKGYVAHLLAAKYSVVPSPASFNNLMGLARAVNDKLTPGTEVFVAEMGIYGEGEIRELSKSFPPDIATITTIGESHLERMGSREVILRAKSEIVENAKTVVLPIDDPDLVALADRCESEGRRVIRVSAKGAKADVSVDPTAGTVTIGKESAPVQISGVGHAVNVAVAVGIAHALDVPLAVLAPRLGNLPTAAHRAEPQQAPSGAIIIDDSYNANPVGAARAVEGGAAIAKDRNGPFIVVTPGMIELGTVQFERNRDFAAQIESVGGKLFAVGYTNRKALVAGHPSAQVFADRPAAMAAALAAAGASGVILVENDLPDHYA
jgi:UDP-N-acetylmuramoyl-tripeptide--D-alanyl-D-alanine ligase